MRLVRNILLILVLVVLSFGTGFNLGSKRQERVTVVSFSAADKERARGKELDFSLFWDVWDRLYTYYLVKSDLEPQKMIYGAISGMVAALGDPYTVFLSPEQNEEAKDDLGGRFEGIGAQLGIKDKKIVVVAPLKNSPAEEAGLSSGDWIVKVDGKETLNWTLPEVVSKIRGPKGSKVRLSVIKTGAENSQDLDVLRDEIKVASVEWEEFLVNCQGGKNEDQFRCQEYENDCQSCQTIFYLKLSRFGDNTNNEWSKVVNEINDRRSKL